MMKIAICDEDSERSKALSKWITAYPGITEVNTYEASALYLADYKKGVIHDLVFVDIEKHGMDGFEMAAYVAKTKRGERPCICFLANNTKYSVQSHGIIIDYIVRPADMARVHSTILEVENRLAKAKIVIESDEGIHQLLSQHIIYVQAFRRGVIIVTEDGNTITSKKVKFESMAGDLGDKQFFLIHRSFLVNTEHIQEYRNHSIFMTDGNNFPVSRRRERALRERLVDDTNKK